jgi:hypothetical protein
MENTSSSRPASGSWWRLPLLLTIVLAGIVAWRIHSLHEAKPEANTHRTETDTSQASHERVTLAIDFGGGRRKNFDAAPWHEGMTVAELMKRTPKLDIVQKGTGESAFLTTIDGVENQGDAGHNWTYAVNGKNADRSFEVYTLRPGDQVLWTFGPRK